MVRRSKPAKKQTAVVIIDESISSLLQSHRERTGIGPQALLHNKRHEKPDGLNAVMISKWLTGSNTTARKDHLDYVLKIWSDISALKKNRIPVTLHILDELNFQRKRTQVTPEKLLKNATDIPEGLSVAHIHRLFYKKTRTASKIHIEYLLSRWKSFPDCKIKPGRNGAEYKSWGYIKITPETKNVLHQYKKQTRIGAEKLLNGAQGIPDGLNAAIINNWLTGGSTTAYSEYIEYVMRTWKELAEGEQERIEITPDIMAALKDSRDRVKRFPSYVLAAATDIPQGLSPHIISSWFSGTAKTARKDHLNYVLDRCKQLNV